LYFNNCAGFSPQKGQSKEEEEEEKLLFVNGGHVEKALKKTVLPNHTSSF